MGGWLSSFFAIFASFAVQFESVSIRGEVLTFASPITAMTRDVGDYGDFLCHQPQGIL
jgi:hypothetical protein